MRTGRSFAAGRLGALVPCALVVWIAGCGGSGEAPSGKQPAEVPTVVAKPGENGDGAVPPGQTEPAPGSGAEKSAATEKGAAPESGTATAKPAPKPAPFVLPLPAELAEQGWIALFDGATLFGWQANSDVDWAVQDGTIVAEKGKPGLLLTTVPFVDYEFHCEYRLAPGGNSGVFLRTTFDPQDPAKDCYELNLCDTHPMFPTGSLVGRRAVTRPNVPEGEWHALDVRVQGRRIEARFNGNLVLGFQDESDAPRDDGFVGLQKNSGKIEFRHVRLRPLGGKPLFDAQTLTGWHVVPGSKAEFVVRGGLLGLQKGPGFLESDGTWDDFVLQFSARTNGDGLNGGVFFRSEPGTEAAPSNGYEFQIHHGTLDGDRTKPQDHGTGAIFRRAPARTVVGNDRQFFTATLVARGDRFATWVDGYQVVDWQDERKDDPNPRKGRRLTAGHLLLQAHDPTTDIDFRSLSIAPAKPSTADK
jgi:hypothetical protein